MKKTNYGVTFMLNNRHIRRLAALSLALLLLLCAGCGSSPAPAEDTPAPVGNSPAPSQSPATPEPTTDPAAEQAPKPEAAATPTDVDAPPVNKPSLATPIERKQPESVQLLSLGCSFTLTNAEDQTLTHSSSSNASGTMAFTQQQISGASDIFSAMIPYSTRYTCETSNVSGDWGFEFLATAAPWCHCVAKGSGKLTGLDYDTGSRLTVRTEPGAELELTLPMPDSDLGENGWVCLHLTAAGSEVSLTADGNSLSFSGLKGDAKAAVSLDYGGFVSGKGLDVAFTGSSGTMDFSNIASGTVGVTGA